MLMMSEELHILELVEARVLLLRMSRWWSLSLRTAYRDCSTSEVLLLLRLEAKISLKVRESSSLLFYSKLYIFYDKTQCVVQALFSKKNYF